MPKIAKETSQKNLKQVVDVEEKKVKLVIFTLSGAHYAFYGDDTKEILPTPRIYPVPGSPDSILGVIDVRGDIQPVIDVKILLDLGKTEQANRIIIVEKNGVRFGTPANSVEDVIDMSVSSIRQSKIAENPVVGFFAIGATDYYNHAVTILDVGKLLEKLAVEQINNVAVEGNAVETIHLLVFNIADSYFGVDMEQIEEILDPPPGVDMEEIPAFHEILSFRETKATYQNPKILFVKDNGIPPVKIDQVRNIVDISLNSIQPLPPLLEGSKKSEAVWSATFIDEYLVLLVDLYRIPVHGTIPNKPS